MSEAIQNTEQKVSDTAVPDLNQKVIQALKSVYDPEIPVDVYELGLIYEINVYPVCEGYHISIGHPLPITAPRKQNTSSPV